MRDPGIGKDTMNGTARESWDIESVQDEGDLLQLQYAVSATHLPCTVAIAPHDRAAYRGRIQRQWIDDIALVDCETGPCSGRRSQSDIASTDDDLAKLPAVSIAAIRGRARGQGSEFALACDFRFASLEKALLGQPEVGVGVIPGGGALEWLPRLVGRSRALEIALSSDDYDARTAELYGWVNRAIPDAEFDEFVDAFARRIAGFDRQPLSQVKRIINERSGLPNEQDILDSQSVFLEATSWPATQQRLAEIIGRGLQRPGDVEMRLGYHLTTLGDQAV